MKACRGQENKKYGVERNGPRHVERSSQTHWILMAIRLCEKSAEHVLEPIAILNTLVTLTTLIMTTPADITVPVIGVWIRLQTRRVAVVMAVWIAVWVVVSGR